MPPNSTMLDEFHKHKVISSLQSAVTHSRNCKLSETQKSQAGELLEELAGTLGHPLASSRKVAQYAIMLDSPDVGHEAGCVSPDPQEYRTMTFIHADAFAEAVADALKSAGSMGKEQVKLVELVGGQYSSENSREWFVDSAGEVSPLK